LTFAFSEIKGRSYGGGVLLLIPATDVDLTAIDALIPKRKITEVLDIIDEVLLNKQFGYSREGVMKMRSFHYLITGVLIT